MVATGTVLQGRYEIEESLGQGGFGAVYRALDRRLKKHVAVKQMLRQEPKILKLFERESELLARMRHPSLPSVTDYFAEDDCYYLVMEYIEGQNLSDYLEQLPPGQVMSEEQALSMIVPIVDSLEYLHRQRPPVIHRDIKPGNIRISSDGSLYLVDFGIARVYDPNAQTMSIMSFTPGYAPLEQYDHGVVEPRSDFYALGATLYTMLTRTPPPKAHIRAMEDALIPPEQINPSVSPQTSTAIMCMMAMRPEDRYADVPTLKRALFGPSLEQIAPLTVDLAEIPLVTAHSIQQEQQGQQPLPAAIQPGQPSPQSPAPAQVEQSPLPAHAAATGDKAAADTRAASAPTTRPPSHSDTPRRKRGMLWIVAGSVGAVLLLLMVLVVVLNGGNQPPGSSSSAAATTPTRKGIALTTSASGTETGVPGIATVPITSTATSQPTRAELYTSGLEAYEDQEWEEASDLFQQVYEQDPEYLDIENVLSATHFNRGIALFEKTRTTLAYQDAVAALEQFTRVLTIKPDHDEAQEYQKRLVPYTGALEALEQEEWRTSAISLEVLLDVQGDYTFLNSATLLYTTYITYAKQLEDDGQFADALRIYRKAEELHENADLGFESGAQASDGVARMIPLVEPPTPTPRPQVRPPSRPRVPVNPAPSGPTSTPRPTPLEATKKD